MTILEKIIGSPARLKTMRFFIQNPGRVVAPRELSKLTKTPSVAVARELSFARTIGLIKRAIRTDETDGAHRHVKKKKVAGFVLADGFPFLQPLRHLVIGASPVSREKMTKYFKSRTGIQLVVLGGVFLSDAADLQYILSNTGNQSAGRDQMLDLLIVANKIKRNAIEPFVKKLEIEIGKELAWAFLTVAEFEYRRGMHDKFLRDMFDYEHECLINKLGVE